MNPSSLQKLTLDHLFDNVVDKYIKSWIRMKRSLARLSRHVQAKKKLEGYIKTHHLFYTKSRCRSKAGKASIKKREESLNIFFKHTYCTTASKNFYKMEHSHHKMYEKTYRTLSSERIDNHLAEKSKFKKHQLTLRLPTRLLDKLHSKIHKKYQRHKWYNVIKTLVL
jgi:hypothetical protein